MKMPRAVFFAATTGNEYRPTRLLYRPIHIADTAKVGRLDLGTTDGEYFLQARLNVSLTGIDRETAQKLVDGAHLQCPYSKATHGNINVVTNLIDAGATNAA
jgi:hypothetical protein